MEVCVLGLRGFPHTEGGVERHCEALYTAMPPGVSLTVFRRRPYVTSGQGYPNIRFVDLPSTRLKGVEPVLHSFLATLRAVTIKPDLVHIHNIGPALFSWMLRCRGIPIVLTFHSPNYEHAKWNWFEKQILRLCEKIAFRNASKIIFVNHFQMEKCPPDVRRKSVYVPNGIFPSSVPSGHGFLDRIGVEPGRYVLAVGRITPEKGFHTLLRAFRRAALQGVKLVIAGGVEFENDYMEALRLLAADAGVVFTGAVFGDDLGELYANAELFVLPSNNEGFPLVLLEAMSYRIDVLVSDIPATHLVPLAPEDYFPCGDVGALAAGIRGKLASPRRRDYDLSGFDWKDIAARTVAAYRDTLASSSSRAGES